ncbi:hypothetical protein [Pseudonocardia thermophila]|uniref:hypothetical protein n=1 Tax=Pseudonocardia thermophila TaxID=1848 RepID=UPI00248EA3C4|nr:hypothetical protein [Pseudonocardia thermophila]
MNEERLSRRTIIAIMATGLVTGVVALVATMFVVGNAKPTYTASALLAVKPSTQIAPGDTLSTWEALSGGQTGRVASEVYQQPRFAAAAAAALGLPETDLRVSAGPPPEAATLIQLTVEAPSPQAAEQAAAQIIKDATPVATDVAGGTLIQIITVQDPAGSAVASGVPATQLLIVVFIGGLLVGSGAALIIARARSRGDDEPESFDSGEFRAVQGYGRPAGPPAPGGRPVNGGGPYGPPRRPVADPRVQQQPPR